MIRRALPLLLALAVLPAQAREVSATVVAKFMKIIASGVPGSKVECQDPEVNAEMVKVQVPRDSSARIVWSDRDVVKLSKAGKLVVCGQRELLAQGAGLAIVTEDGRPVIYINLANVAASKVTVPEAVLRIAKPAN